MGQVMSGNDSRLFSLNLGGLRILQLGSGYSSQGAIRHNSQPEDVDRHDDGACKKFLSSDDVMRASKFRDYESRNNRCYQSHDANHEEHGAMVPSWAGCRFRRRGSAAGERDHGWAGR